MQDYAVAFAFVSALIQGDPNLIPVDVRMIHDSDKAVAGIPRRGLFPQLWPEICHWNNAGYGCFININEMDGNGRELANVKTIRCQAIDLDNLSAPQNYERAIAFNPAPSFAVQTSPNKFQVYWQTIHHSNRDGFTLLQRKLRTLFDGDKTIIDPSRILRIPGTYHLKNPAAPHLVTTWTLSGFGKPVDASILELALANVNIIDGGGGRHELGDPDLQAPGLEWLTLSLKHIDPNNLDRGEWISITSAFKQAGWNWASEQQLFDMWSQWCAQYTTNNPAENKKNWDSIRNTEIGWQSFERRVPQIAAMRLFGENKREYELKTQPAPSTSQQTGELPTTPMPTTPAPLPVPYGEFLTDAEQRDYFKGCVFIERMGQMLTPTGRFMNSTQFNGTFGGKKFIIDGQGKTTNEPWQAATRSTLWTVPKADHIRFVPRREPGKMIKDALGRVGVNTYKPAIINAQPGDITPFLKHMEYLLPSEIDRRILFDYLAHNARFPGYKIPWAPFIQSAEGAGKGVLKSMMRYVMGPPYVHFPNAQELIESGSKFNAWMRAKLFIIVDEIKVDEKRDLIEILKPMISEQEIEIQGKGVDQDLEDNPSNWMMFSNWRDAIPVTKNSRRFSIFYSPMQSANDILQRGLDQRYFQELYKWQEDGGNAHIAHWLLNYPIDQGNVPMRAPLTTSTAEAVKQSRGPVETTILDAIEDQAPGFRHGWVSSLAVANRLKGTGVRHVSIKTLANVLDVLGYHQIGRAPRAFILESKDTRADLFHWDRNARVEGFGPAQGYEF